jgi:hypothetical protein
VKLFAKTRCCCCCCCCRRDCFESDDRFANGLSAMRTKLNNGH